MIRDSGPAGRGPARAGPERPPGAGREAPIQALAEGFGSGTAVVLDEPLSFWGGMDSATGEVIDRRHPQFGALLAGRVVVMPSGRGSSSSSSVLAEAVRAGTAPAAMVLRKADPIVALGALVARELYGAAPPVVVANPEAHATIRTGDRVTVDAVGRHASIQVEG